MDGGRWLAADAWGIGLATAPEVETVLTPDLELEWVQQGRQPMRGLRVKRPLSGLEKRSSRQVAVMPGPSWLALIAAGLMVSGCSGSDPAATVAPTVPALVIVTATPGLPPAPTLPRSAEQRYIVREGDSLSIIAARFGVTEGAIMRANNLSNPDRVLVGQELIIPPPEP